MKGEKKGSGRIGCIHPLPETNATQKIATLDALQLTINSTYHQFKALRGTMGNTILEGYFGLLCMVVIPPAAIS